ncbi:hypothetical protein [Streptomyces sp. NPDC002559]
MPTDWRARVVAEEVKTPTDDQLSTVRSAGSAVAVIHEGDSGVCTVDLRVEAGTLAQATTEALRRVRAAMKEAGLAGTLTDVRVCTEAKAYEEEAHPREKNLMGPKEAGAFLGVSRQRVMELLEKHAAFPQPLARLASGPVFSGESIAIFHHVWDRRPGRQPGRRQE